MNLKPLILLLFPIILLTSCSEPASSDIMDNLKIISGNWSTHKGIKFNEKWKYIDQNTIEGLGFSLNRSDTTFSEVLKIEVINDTIYYRVFFDMPDESVDFRLQEASKNRWMFVNPYNDYPSIITYHIESDSFLTVTTSNIRGNKEQVFYLKRIN